MATLSRPVSGSRSRNRRNRPRSQAGVLVYGSLVVAIVLSVFPLYWTFIVASRTNSAIGAMPPPLLPGSHFFDNIRRVFSTESVNFGEALLNSAIASSAITISVVFFSSLAGFAFAKLPFRGRNILLLLVIATMAIPQQLGIIPLYILMGGIGWNGTLQAVVVPFMVNAFGVFLMRQYIIEAVPTQLLEAARVDGCSTWRMYLNVVVPAIRPAAAVLGLLTFMQYWNDFLWPVVTLTPETPTVPVALKVLASGYVQDYALILTGAALATLPLLVVFVLFGRQIVGGIMEGVVKG